MTAGQNTPHASRFDFIRPLFRLVDPMFPVDPTLLSAYLDHELDPVDRTLVEQAIHDDPKLADELEQIRETQLLLRRLPLLEAPTDVARQLQSRVDEVRGMRIRRQERRRAGMKSFFPLGLVSAVAALLLIAWGIQTIQLRHDAPIRPVPSDVAAVRHSPNLPVPAEPALDEPATETLSMTAVGDDRPSVPADPPLLAVASSPLDQLDQDQVRSLLGRSEVRRLLITVDRADQPLLDRLDKAIQNAPRAIPDQARITVAQGLAIDPQHPEDAIVYAVVLDDTELENFRDNLVEAVPAAAIVDEPVPPAIVALLAESPHADFTRVDPRGTILNPRPGPLATDFAIRFSDVSPSGTAVAGTSGLSVFPPSILSPFRGVRAGSPMEILRPRVTGPVPRTLASTFARRAARIGESHTRERVYLVWIVQRS